MLQILQLFYENTKYITFFIDFPYKVKKNQLILKLHNYNTRKTSWLIGKTLLLLKSISVPVPERIKSPPSSLSLSLFLSFLLTGDEMLVPGVGKIRALVPQRAHCKSWSSTGATPSSSTIQQRTSRGRMSTSKSDSIKRGSKPVIYCLYNLQGIVKANSE